MPKTKKIAFLSLMLAMTVVLSTLEHSIPPIPFFPPNVKLGLSNIIVMYCVFFVGGKEAIQINILKSVLVFIIRGPIAGLISFSGGLLSILIILFCLNIFKNSISYVMISILGAISHNIGQIFMASFFIGLKTVIYYLPLSIIFGIVMGFITGTILKVILPFFEKVFGGVRL